MKNIKLSFVIMLIFYINVDVQEKLNNAKTLTAFDLRSRGERMIEWGGWAREI
jgi:hypothetical protein